MELGFEIRLRITFAFLSGLFAMAGLAVLAIGQPRPAIAFGIGAAALLGIATWRHTGRN